MRYLRFERFLDDFLGLDAVEEVYFEEVRRHAGTTAAHVYGGLLAVLTAWCEENEIPYAGIPVGTIKKHASGKGNAGKDVMISTAREKWPGQNIPDGADDQADALWILNAGLEGLA